MRFIVKIILTLATSVLALPSHAAERTRPNNVILFVPASGTGIYRMRHRQSHNDGRPISIRSGFRDFLSVDVFLTYAPMVRRNGAMLVCLS